MNDERGSAIDCSNMHWICIHCRDHYNSPSVSLQEFMMLSGSKNTHRSSRSLIFNEANRTNDAGQPKNKIPNSSTRKRRSIKIHEFKRAKINTPKELKKSAKEKFLTLYNGCGAEGMIIYAQPRFLST